MVLRNTSDTKTARQVGFLLSPTSPLNMREQECLRAEIRSGEIRVTGSRSDAPRRGRRNTSGGRRSRR